MAAGVNGRRVKRLPAWELGGSNSTQQAWVCNSRTRNMALKHRQKFSIDEVWEAFVFLHDMDAGAQAL